MKYSMRTFACGFVFAVGLYAVGCGGKESVASRSAAAYREAEAKGVPVGGGHEHGGHEVATGTAAEMGDSDHRTADHSEMVHGAADGPSAAHGASEGAMGHTGRGHTITGDAHADHRMPSDRASRDPHAGMQHGNASAGTDPHTGHPRPPEAMPMQHGQHGMTESPTQQHDTMAHEIVASAPRTADTPNTTSEMTAIDPPTILRVDRFDAPVAISVTEAARAAAGMSHGDAHTVHTVPGEDHAHPPIGQPEGHERHEHQAPAPPPSEPLPSSTEAPVAQPSDAVRYACPMHPEVTSTTPGTCPTCGMALVVEERMKEEQ